MVAAKNHQAPPSEAPMESVLLSQVEKPSTRAFMEASTRDIQRALKKLSAKTPRFQSSGVTRLGVTVNGEEEELLLPIRSVSMELTSRLLEEAYVDPPRHKKMNIETMEFEMVKDEHDPAYQRKLQQANVHFLKRYALHALDCELENEAGELVWSPSQGIAHEMQALQVLDAQGLTQTHYAQIRTDTERLSMTDAQYAETLRARKSSVR